MLTAVVGINWGDEGKGRMVDLLSESSDIVCRYQGGNIAGHTVINHLGRFKLNLIPVGILREGVVNIIGPGMVLDLAHLCGEIAVLREKGIKITPDNLKISDKVCICLPYHKSQDILEDDRLGDKKYGPARRGIAPAYGDKYMKKSLRAADLLEPSSLKQKLSDILEWKNILLSGYGAGEINLSEVLRWVEKHGSQIAPFVTDTTEYLYEASLNKKRILFEGQQGTLRDIDYGIYPYTTSSQTLAAYAPIGAGLPGARLDRVVGVMKSFSSCIGEGPFTAELFGEEAKILSETGPEPEYGAPTGRARRIGALDIPASRYGVRIQGANELTLTKLDVLSHLKEIPVCVAYEIDGKRTENFPIGDALLRAKPIFEYFPGFSKDISGCRRPEDLPIEAKNYVEYVENALKCPITYVSVGPEREDYLLWKN